MKDVSIFVEKYNVELETKKKSDSYAFLAIYSSPFVNHNQHANVNKQLFAITSVSSK